MEYWSDFEEGSAYHIYNRSINKETIFKTDENYYFFLRRWETFIVPFFQIGAYCIMPNHFHFLVWVKFINSEIIESIQQQNTVKSKSYLNGEISYNEFLEDQYKRLFQSYALAFNKQEHRHGNLFQKRFKRVSISHENKLMHLLGYIHHNPIHHKFVERYIDWKFSSYSIFLSNEKTFLAREYILKLFATDEEEGKELYLEFHNDFKEDFKDSTIYLED